MDRTIIQHSQGVAASPLKAALVRAQRRLWRKGSKCAAGAIGVVAIASLLGACAPTARPAAEDSRTLTIAYPDTPGILDGDQAGTSMAEEVQQNTHGGDVLRYRLVEDEHGLWMEDLGAPGFEGIENGLAESWEASDDLRTFTMHLRPDVVSGYGNPLTADDVIWSWQKRYTMGTSAVGFGVAGGVTSADQVIKVDDLTVRFELDEPNSLFPKVNAVLHAGGLYDSVEVKKHATDEDPWALDYLAHNSGGFGAYTVADHTPGQEIVFVANPNYFRGEPYFERIVWRSVANSSERLAMLTRGDVDVATALSARELEQARNTAGLKVTDFVANREMHLRLNNAEAPFDDVRVRQALAYAMPVDQIIETVYNGQARPIKSQLSELVAGYTDEFWVYDYDTGRARELLEEAGVKDLSFEVIYDTSIPELETVGVIMQTAFAEAGVDIELQGLPAANYADRRGARDFQGALGENYPYIQDPAYTVQLFFRSDHEANWANYSNPEYDEIANALPNVVDEAERERLTLRAQEIWMHDQPWIMIANPGFHVAHREGLTGFVWGGDNTLRYEKLRND